MAYVLLTTSILFLYSSIDIYNTALLCVLYNSIIYLCRSLLCHSAVHALCIQKIALALLLAAF